MNDREKGSFVLGLILGLVVAVGALVVVISHGIWQALAIAGLACMVAGVASVLWVEPTR